MAEYIPLSPNLREPQTTDVIFDGEYQQSPSYAAEANRRDTFRFLPENLIGSAVGESALGGTPLTFSQASEVAKMSGVTMPTDKLNNTTSEVLRFHIENAKAQEHDRAIIARTKSSTALSARMLAESFGIQFMSPINVASGLLSFGTIPATVSGSRVLGYTAAREAAKRSAAKSYAEAGILGRAKIGAVEGVLGNVLIEAGTYPLANYINYDYTMNDALLNIALGAPFGGVLHAAPKAFSTAYKALRRDRVAASLPNIESTPPELRDSIPIHEAKLDDDMQVLSKNVDNEINDIVSELYNSGVVDIPVSRTDIPKLAKERPDIIEPERASVLESNVAKISEAKKEAETSPYGSFLGTAKDIKKYVTDKARREKAKSAASVDMYGNVKKSATPDFTPKPIRAWLKKQGLKNTEGNKKNLIERGINPSGVLRSNGKLDGLDNIPISEFNSYLSDYNASAIEDSGYVSLSWLDDQLQMEGVGKGFLTNAQIDAIAAASSRDDVLSLLGRNGYDDPLSMSVDDIAKALHEISGGKAVNETNDTIDALSSLSPETHDAANKVAMSQLLSDRPVDVDAVLRTDGNYDGDFPTANDIEGIYRPYADEDAADQWDGIDENNAELSKYENLDSSVNDYIEAARSAADDGIEYSRGNGNGGSNASDIMLGVRSSFGKYTEKLMDDSKLHVVQSTSDLPKGIDYPSDVKGVKMQDGTVFIVADNVSPPEITGLVLHEIGVHVGMRSMMGDESFSRMLSDIMSSDDPRIEMAREAVPSGTKAENIAEETLAYLVQRAPEHGLVRNIIAAVKAWLIKNLNMKFEVDEFTARHLAIGALRRVSKMGDGKSADALFSRVVDDVVKTDNPGGEWLANKQKYADEDYAKGRKISGPVTGYTKVVDFPTSEAVKIKGANGENPVAGTPKFDALMESVKKDGFNDADGGILIGINHKGEAYILEGNNRAAVANAIGKKTLKAEVKYYAGGELANGNLAPQKLNQLLSPTERTSAASDLYQPSTGTVDGRVVREDVPNMGSISASLNDYKILPGIQDVSLSSFEVRGRPKNLDARTRELANQIKESGEITPLIVVHDAEGLYILEGSHRFDALRELEAKSLPAKVVIDLESPPVETAITERTSAGEQSVIPGAEKISDKALAERKMEQPLKGKKPQEAMDIGMFGDDAKQTVLFSRGVNEKLSEVVEKRQKSLLKELSVFDAAMKESEKYPALLRKMIGIIDDDEALKEAIEKAGVPKPLVAEMIAALQRQGRLVTKRLRGITKGQDKMDLVANASGIDEAIAIAAAEEMQKRIMIQKRNTVINFAARENLHKRVRGFGGDFADEGFLSITAGSHMLRNGARDHIAARQDGYTNKWAKMARVAMQKEGVWEIFSNGALDKQLSAALEQMDKRTPDLTGIHKDAVTMAKIMRKIQDEARLTQNRYGAYIPYLKNFIVHQSHDQNKISKAGFSEWVSDARRWFNLREMDIDEKGLRQIYNELSSGLFDTDKPIDVSGYVGFGTNVGKKVSQSRTILFKEGAWFDYNKKYGSNSVASAYMKGLKKAGEVAGLMSALGTNPEKNMTMVIDQTLESLKNVNPSAAKRLRERKAFIMDTLQQVDGRAHQKGNVTVAAIGSNIRAWQSTAKLGAAFFASMADLGTYAASVRYEGRGNMFTGMAEAIGGIAKSFTNKADRQNVLEMLDVAFDHDIGNTIHRFSRDGSFTHNVQAFGHAFGKWNLQTGWTTRNQETAAIMFANDLGKKSGITFKDLGKDTLRVFKLHGIDEAKWDVLRSASQRLADGRVYLTTNALDYLPDSALESYVKSRGVTVSDKSIANAREAISRDYRAMLIDRAETAVLVSDKRVQAMATAGTKPGTAIGEAVRMVMQFKSFPLTFWERMIKKEIYGRGYDSLGDYWRNGKSDMVGMASFLLTSFGLGYLSLSIKEALKGRTPPPLWGHPANVMRAMQQGGGMGIYGDILLREYDRNRTSSLAEVLAGPTIGSIGGAFDLMTSIANGDKSAIKATRLILSNTPGANLFYVKPALDNLLMYKLMEDMNPGFIRRMEANSIRETGQQWILPPSQALR